MSATCAICASTVEEAELLRHLSEHGESVEVESWPDGSPVLYEPDAKPEDAL